MSAMPLESPRSAASLANAPLRVLDGFGGAVRAACRYLAPRSVAELEDAMARAGREGMALAFRGAGRSYGDASLNAGRLVVDTSGLNRILSWEPATGVAEVEPGVTIADLWRRILPDGFWPAVVPGTMAATLAGCAAMNVHGKNDFAAGPIGEHLLGFDLLTPDGRTFRCSREENAEVFHAAIGGFGALGAFTRLALKLKRVESGLLRVEPVRTRSLAESFDVFEERLPRADYLVGWLDGLAGGASLGRGVLHQANYLKAAEDPEGPAATLRIERQDLPATILGFPRSLIWRFMRPFANDLGMRLVNLGQYWASALHRRGATYLQSHAAFAFLLDYVPNWRLAYGRAGFIQYQPFVPKAAAREVFSEILESCRREGLPPYLAVMKRHRPDPFLLTHALDGWSLALDFPARRREQLWALCHRLSDLVLDAGGRFYFAKDALLRPADVERAWGRERLERFSALKRRLDPAGVLQSDLMRRALPAL
ncbi:MAG: FAD-binding oxidoreductase [Myxococcales bacterium]